MSLPISYHGLPLSVKSSSVTIWNPVIERMSSKLSACTRKHLSKGGKLVMFKSVLASVPIHFLSLFQALKSVINKFEKLQRDFLWGSSNTQRKIHWVGWKDICNP